MEIYTIQNQGYYISFDKNYNYEPEIGHFFCGTHNVKGAWCPNCNKPLLRLLLIDSNDEKLSFNFSNIKKLPLFYCWTCNIAQELFVYRIINDEEIEIVMNGAGGVEEDFPYNNYPVNFPGTPFNLEEISIEDQKIISQLNNRSLNRLDVLKRNKKLAFPNHQIGGEPLLIQGNLEVPTCPLCKNSMPFLSTVSDHCLDKRGFTGNEYVQVVYSYCEDCRTVGAIQQCD